MEGTVGIQARGFTSNAREFSPGGDDSGTPLPFPQLLYMQTSQGPTVRSGWPTDSSQATTPDVIPDSPPLEGRYSSERRNPPGQDGPTIPVREPRALIQGSKPEASPEADSIAHGPHMGLKLKEPADLPWDPGKRSTVSGSIAGAFKLPCFKGASSDILLGAAPRAFLQPIAEDLYKGRGELGMLQCHPPTARGAPEGSHGAHRGCAVDSAPAGCGVGEAFLDDATSPLPGPSHLRRSSSGAAIWCSEEQPCRKRHKTAVRAQFTRGNERPSLRVGFAHLHALYSKDVKAPPPASGIEGFAPTNGRIQSECGFGRPLQPANNCALDEGRSAFWVAGGGRLVLELGSSCEEIDSANCLGGTAGNDPIGSVIPKLTPKQASRSCESVLKGDFAAPDCDFHGAPGFAGRAADAAVCKNGTLMVHGGALGSRQETGVAGGGRVPDSAPMHKTLENWSDAAVQALPYKPQLGASTDTQVPVDECHGREKENLFTPGPTNNGLGPVLHTKQLDSSSGELSYC